MNVKQKELLFKTKIMELLCQEYREYGVDFDDVQLELCMGVLHGWMEDAATDFAKMLELEYTPVFFYGG